jgi:large subunit ribosomal protein L21
MRYAIIESGGKQYKAVVGETIEVDRLSTDIGKKLNLEDILMVADGESVIVGAPTVAGAKVAATVVDQIKAPKVIVFKYHPSKRYRLKKGHRQKYTRLLIDSVDAKGLVAAAPVKAEPKEKSATVKEKVSSATKPPTKAESATKKTPAAQTKPAAKKASATKAAPKKEASAPSTRKKLSGFDIADKTIELLEAAEVSTVSQLLKLLADGDKAVLAINGIGPKALEDIKKVLKKEGYSLP